MCGLETRQHISIIDTSKKVGFKYIFGFMFDFYKNPLANTMYTRLQNCANMSVGKQRIQTNIQSCGGCVTIAFVFAFGVFVPTNANSILFLDKWFFKFT